MILIENPWLSASRKNEFSVFTRLTNLAPNILCADYNRLRVGLAEKLVSNTIRDAQKLMGDNQKLFGPIFQLSQPISLQSNTSAAASRI
jgi:hypothetical protein